MLVWLFSSRGRGRCTTIMGVHQQAPYHIIGTAWPNNLLQVMAGRVTLMEVTLQCSGGGAWIKKQGCLVMHACKVAGAASSAIQVGRVLAIQFCVAQV